jgi:hypothetical protein
MLAREFEPPAEFAMNWPPHALKAVGRVTEIDIKKLARKRRRKRIANPFIDSAQSNLVG